MKDNKSVFVRRRKQKERSEAARSKLIEAAVTLICRQGFANTTTQQIATYAGLTRGAIQYHFKGRAELFASVVNRVEDDWLRSFEAASPDKNLAIRERIYILIDHLWSVVQTPLYRAAVDICFNSRADLELRDIVQKAIDVSTEDFSRYWQRTFSPEISDDKIREGCALLSAFSQGMVISSIYTRTPDKIPSTTVSSFETAKILVANYMLDE